MILIIDNYDSFTYNVVQALGVLDQEPVIYRNNRITVEEAKKLDPDYLVISPGPGRPEDGGVSNDMIKAFAGKVPILGVCLGHQCIAYVYGGSITNAEKLIHGKSARIYHDSRTLYSGLSNPILGGRYHSLTVAEKSLPSCLEISAYTPEGEIMGIRHRELPIEGVQFHPESILTETGKMIFQNFLNLKRSPK